MEKDFITQLPKKRTGNYLDWIANFSVRRIILIGLLAYIIPVLLFSIIECVSLKFGWDVVETDILKPIDFWDLIYFNFITVLTVGYGDFSPVGFGRFISIIEASIGVVALGLIISFITAKLLASPKNSIVFSKYGYYCSDEDKFLVIFVNTTNALFVNAEMCFYFKLSGDWAVRPAIRAPFITRSVQTFHLDIVPLDVMINELKDGDVLRFAIDGKIGYASHSAAIEYDLEHILVISNRNELTAFPGFINADFSSDELIKMFHYKPEGASNLKIFIDAQRNRMVVQ